MRLPMVLCAAFLACMAGSACKTMKPVSLDQLGALKPDKVWVKDTTQGNQMMLLTQPQFVNDTLVGFAGGNYQELPRAHIEQVQVQENATTRTVLLSVGIAAAIGGFAYAITGSGGSKTTNAMAGDCDKHPDDPSCMQ